MQEIYQLKDVIPIHMQGDNVAANLIAEKTAGLRKVRHLTLADLYVRECTETGRIVISHVPGTENTADLLTKILKEEQLLKLLGLLHMHNAPL